MNFALTSLASIVCNNQHISSSSSSSSSSGNVITPPSAHYIFGAGNYMTLHPELYYPNACLFCGLPNGAKKEPSFTPTSTNQEVDMVATAAPALHFYSTETNEKPYNHLLEIIIHKHPTSRSLAFIMSKRIQIIFQKWRRYLIRKRIHFPAMTQGRKRVLIRSLF